jgi:tetratricopeptide (TPR) repeat protein
MGQSPLGASLRKVEAEIAAGRPEQALALCQEVQSRYPRALAVQRVLGEAYLALRKPREALGALERALAGDPEDARALCARAVVYQMHGDSMAALAWYRRACDVRPEDQVLRATYRELAAHLGQPPYHPTRLGLARLYLRGDLLDHALREWESLAAELPDSLDVQVGLAEALWRTRRFQAAEEQCRRMLANAPTCVRAMVLLAVMLHDRGLLDEARRHAQRAAELDPEQRTAQSLFADRLTAGDRGLQSLLFGDQAGAGGRDPTDSASRPLASLAPQGALPAGTQQLLSETEYMLWGPDEETRARAALAARARAEQANAERTSTEQTGASHSNQANQAPTAPGGAERPAPRQTSPDLAGRLGQFLPPALVEQGTGMDDTERRASLEWLQWLQAQGALMQPTQPNQPNQPRGRGAAPAAPSGAAAPQRGRPSNAPSSGAPAEGGAGGAPPTRPRVPTLPPRTTGPLSASDTEALRAMFAELDPGARGVGGAAAVATGAPGASGVDRTPPGPAAGPPGTMGDGGAAGWDSTTNAPTGWLAESAPDPRVRLDLGPHESETERLAQAHALRQAGGGALPPDAVTIESLERQFSSSGYQHVEPQPGMLAAMSAGSTLAAPGDSAPTASAAAQIPPDDYPARLRFARQRRGAGRLDDALAEYRALLKLAPELLPDILADLNECVRMAPEYGEVHRLLGDARIQQGDYLGALEAYNRAVALTQPDAL